MILSGKNIRKRSETNQLIEPFAERTAHNGKTYGLSYAGYDIRVNKFLILETQDEVKSIVLQPGEFVLASSIEHINMPNDLLCIVHDKSSWARVGLAAQNTVLEPGWRGYITLELSNHSKTAIQLVSGDPIVQLIFHVLDEAVEAGYDGKYQNQPNRPVQSIHEPRT